MNEPAKMIHELDELLDIERQALLDGDLEVLANLVEKKEALIDALNNAETENAETLLPVNQKVTRNQALLEQALNGIRTVARQLAEIRQTRQAFDTYDKQGQKSTIKSENEVSVEKRA